MVAGHVLCRRPELSRSLGCRMHATEKWHKPGYVLFDMSDMNGECAANLGDRIICMNKKNWIAAVAFLAHVTAAILRVGSAGGMDVSRYMIRSHMGSGALGMHSSRSAAILSILS